ncbi:DUF859 family phage minor structural protein [Clostridium sp.]|uniref:DUF859 family phage minor structural protein n=1 Tax=Clostridium sp. TaxID=1506 RepID=UPI0032170152
MATSSYFDTSNTYVKYWFEVIQTSQSISGNNSTVTVKVWAKRTNTGYTTWGDGSISCVINGKSYSYSGSYTITSSSVCLQTISGIGIPHNSDGTKSLTVSGSIAIPGAGLTSSSHSFTTSLTTIPRTSSMSLSASSINAGSTITVNISRASSSFTHAVGFYFGNHTVSLGTSIGTSVSYAIPISFLDAIPNSTSGIATMVVDTYNGSTRIGSTSKTFTITTPSNIVPSFSSLSITRVNNSVPSAWDMYVKGKSQAILTINGASGIYGSSITKYSISGGGYSSTSSSFTTGVLNTAGTNTFTATITDSRGRSATKTVTCSVVDYFAPYLDFVEAFRCNSSGVADENGTYIKVKANYYYASLNGKNGFVADVRYSVYNSGSWSSAYGMVNNVYGIIGGGSISVDNSYDVKFRIADYFTAHEVFTTVSTPSVTMDFKKGGKGIGIGKVSQTDNVLDIAWDTIIDKGLSVSGDANFYGDLFIKGSQVDTARVVYNYTNGILIDIAPATSLYRMVAIEIKGNGYGQDPINTIIQGYHYTPQGNIINCKQINFGEPMTNATFMIHDGRLKVWTQQSTSYQTLKISVFTGGGVESSFNVKDSGIPAGATNKVVCSNRPLAGGTIVSSWSNSNGNVVRFYDGTQICWVYDEPTNQAINTAYGSLFIGSRPWTFPAPFISIPVVECTQFKWGTSASWGSVSDTTSTSTSLRGLDAFSRAAGTYCKISAMAIGKWK